MLFDGKEEGCPAAVGVFDVVEGIERAEKGGAAVDMEVDTTFEIEGAGHVFTCGEEDGLDGAFAAIACRSAVDGCLDGVGVECLAIALGAKIGYVDGLVLLLIGC